MVHCFAKLTTRPAGIVGVALLLGLAVALLMFSRKAGLWQSSAPDSRIVKVGTIEHKPIKESSGIVASRRYPGVFWTHNDKGNAPLIYAITRDGKLVGEVRLTTKNADWEDITVDDQGHLYIAMTGNNDGKRKEVQVVRIDEPDPKAEFKGRTPRVREFTTWRLTYPKAPFDSESLFVHQGFGYLISKVTDNREATIYRFPLAETSEPIVLEPVTTIPVRTPVTAAALSADGSCLAVLSRENLHVFRVDGDIANAGKVRPVQIRLMREQLEGCCFTNDGVVITAESRGIHLVPATAFQ